MPRRRPGETPEERDRRRELQRGYEKASYHRKKEAIASLKTEVENLQREFQELSARRVEVVEVKAGGSDWLSETHTDSESDDHVALVIDWDAAKRRRNAAVRRLYRTKQAVDELRTENSQLQSDIEQRLLLEAQLRELLDEDLTTSPTSSTQPFAFLSLPYQEYAETIAKAQDIALSFYYDDAKLSTGSLAFGWRDYRKPLQHGYFDFAFEKEFSSPTMDEMQSKLWAIFSSADSYRSMYAGSLNPRVYLLEQINEDTLMYHIQLDLFPGVTAKGIHLVSRVAIDGGYLFVMIGVDPKLICFCDNDRVDEANARRIEWHVMCGWLVLEEKSANRTLLHSGGRNQLMCMLEILLSVLRAQAKVVGPLVALPSSDDP